MLKAVLFDLDGTLLDTLEDIANACNAALASYGFPSHPNSAYKHYVGDGVAVLISRAVPAGNHSSATLNALQKAYREEYHRHWDATTKAYDGIAELLDELTRRQIPLAVLSNKPDEFTRRCVAEYFSPWKFSMVTGASEAFPPKPDPAAALHTAKSLGLPGETIAYVGDTDTDMKTAVAAGMVPFGASWGFRSAEELRESGARHLLEHPCDLLKFIC